MGFQFNLSIEDYLNALGCPESSTKAAFIKRVGHPARNPGQIFAYTTVINFFGLLQQLADEDEALAVEIARIENLDINNLQKSAKQAFVKALRKLQTEIRTAIEIHTSIDNFKPYNQDGPYIKSAAPQMQRDLASTLKQLEFGPHSASKDLHVMKQFHANCERKREASPIWSNFFDTAIKIVGIAAGLIFGCTVAALAMNPVGAGLGIALSIAAGVIYASLFTAATMKDDMLRTGSFRKTCDEWKQAIKLQAPIYHNASACSKAGINFFSPKKREEAKLPADLMPEFMGFAPYFT